MQECKGAKHVTRALLGWQGWRPIGGMGVVAPLASLHSCTLGAGRLCAKGIQPERGLVVRMKRGTTTAPAGPIARHSEGPMPSAATRPSPRKGDSQPKTSIFMRVSEGHVDNKWTNAGNHAGWRVLAPGRPCPEV